jgi:hypothetical protein
MPPFAIDDSAIYQLPDHARIAIQGRTAIGWLTIKVMNLGTARRGIVPLKVKGFTGLRAVPQAWIAN